MEYGSLFTGIGGFDLPAEWIGWNIVFHCEIDRQLREDLKTNWPNAINYGDIKTTDFTVHRGQIDILTGGDPCQPHSVAGLGKGKEDDRYLWPEMFRAIRECKPTWIINENVTGSISNGILDLKIDDLESEGYEAQSYCVPAEAVGALHKRERVWLVAFNPNYRNEIRATGKIQSKSEKKIIQERNKIQYFGEPVDLRIFTSDTDSERQQEQYFAEKPGVCPEGLSRYFGFGPYPHGNITRNNIKSGIIRMFNGLPEGMDYTRRNQRLKALGNAIVPQVAYDFFKLIDKIENS
jgi:DNA (cytosine-5)-methyltransferase 1